MDDPILFLFALLVVIMILAIVLNWLLDRRKRKMMRRENVKDTEEAIRRAQAMKDRAQG